jgi:hypothetical protein
MTRTNLYKSSHANASRVLENFEWICAIDAFDFDDPEPLLDLVKERMDPPHELRPILDSILAGKRCPNKKAASKQKITGVHRLSSAGLASALLGFVDESLTMNDPTNSLTSLIKLIETFADERGIETIDIVREFGIKKKRVISDVAARYRITTRTLEGHIRDLRRIIEDYPNF